MSRGGKPLWSFTTSWAIPATASSSAIAIIQALYHRERTGAGTVLSTPRSSTRTLLNSSYAWHRPDGRASERPKTEGDAAGLGAR